jgi:primosomal protein N'
MFYISVVPAIRTPFGVDVFDYRVDDASDIQPGDLIRVPFRRRSLPALVIERAEHSKYSGKILGLNNLQPLVRFPAVLVQLLHAAAARTFCSQATVLQAWIRKVPVRTTTLYGRDYLAPTKGGRTGSPLQTKFDLTEYVVDRRERILEHARQASGRTLIITPWQNRADELAQTLNSPVLHAGVALGQAWRYWTHFVLNTNSVLVTTRLGAWLAHAADTVILDEPENDDHKQDELTPRLDARWLINSIKKLNPNLAVLKISTTPPLIETPNIDRINIPEISVPQSVIPFEPGSYSAINEINALTESKLQDAVEAGQSIVILHPIRGERARSVCRDCGWKAECAFCGFPLSQLDTQAHCGRCGRKSELPAACPACGNADLGKSRTGKSKLARQIQAQFKSAKITILDLTEWREYELEKNSLVVVTDLGLIGGYVEDIRRRERLIIAWRRLAAQIFTNQSELVIQGQAPLLDQARAWLTPEGVKTAWQKEWADRQAFNYPPANQRIKILVDGHEAKAEEIKQRLEQAADGQYSIQGPFKVLFRSSTRRPRSVLHLLPVPAAKFSAIRTVLQPLAKDTIIDLDPIAFFM